jgi:diadenosine tetraphosphatase ApaH/serine/threonine PP2A family protein phosphatase
MKLAILSDIHANLEALDASLADIRKQGADEIICLGDIVGYGANPNECVDRIRDACPRILLGNHDAAAIGSLSTEHFNIHAKIAIEWTSENLSTESRDFLAALPLKETNGTLTFVHATPYEPNMWYYITSLEEAAFNFQFFDTTFCFIGHTHIPIIIVLNENKDVFVHQDPQIDAAGMPGSQLLVNVGSVGQPRDRNPMACYGILDTEEGVFTYRRVEYDLQKTQSKMRKIKMPEFLISRLNDGR